MAVELLSDGRINANGAILESTPAGEEKRRLLEYLIAFGGLNLTPDDFWEDASGDFVCTNEKLLSLL